MHLNVLGVGGLWIIHSGCTACFHWYLVIGIAMRAGNVLKSLRSAEPRRRHAMVERCCPTPPPPPPTSYTSINWSIWGVHIPSIAGPHTGWRQASHVYFGLRSTRMTESPRRNILLMKRSLFTGVLPFLPLPVLGICGETSRAE